MVEKTTHYLNGLQYFQSRLQFIPISQGYVNATTIRGNYRFNYVYNYLDHLGNVRLSYGRDPQARNEIKILEENHYYPYGLKHTNYNANLNAYKKDNNDQVQLTGTGLSADLINKYKFNGQEWQDELGLNLYDMDMRDYDPAIGRWLGIDPVTHYSQSPYCGMDNNPVSFADPSGADGVVPDIGGTIYGMAGQSVSVNYGGPMGGHTRVWMGAHSEYEMSWDGHENANAGSNIHSVEVNGCVYLPEVTVGGNSNGWASAIEQHVYAYSPYYQTNFNQLINNAGAFGLGWGTKEILMKGAVAESRGLSIAKINNISNIRALGAGGAQYMKWAGRISMGANIAGAGLTVIDGVQNGFKAHHAADIGIQAGVYALSASIPVAGWAVGGAYFFTDMYFQSTHEGMSITQYYLDN